MTSLDRRYESGSGAVHLTGIQALARLPIDQIRADRAAGLSTAVFISGYEGSPLAGYDIELLRQQSLLDDHGIVFTPGLNEEAAATAVQGSQLAQNLPKKHDGIAGLWFGKSPGLDRASDALRHANLMGTDPRGGAVALVGDDPGAKSSTVPGASEASLADLGIPTLFPADPADALQLGRHAFAMSRACGVWTALKVVTAVADGSQIVDLTDQMLQPKIPEGAGLHQVSGRLIQPSLGILERDLMTNRLALAASYGRLNQLNDVVVGSDDDRIGIIAAGKTFLDVQHALRTLGLDENELRRRGIRLVRISMVWPMNVEDVVELTTGLDHVIVIEEKRAFVESIIKDLLYGRAGAPPVIGKIDREGQTLFPSYGELSADSITRPLARTLLGFGNVPSVEAWQRQRESAPASRTLLPVVPRTPYYCSGCPHNSSTTVTGDSLVGGGIGCHAMVMLMDSSQVGDVVGLTQMGGEGMQWIGMAPFVDAVHLVQNIGDGTFHHSGSLAIRAAVAANVSLTYRLLYNSAVAMTGGQHAVGQMTVPQLVAHLRSEGVARIIVTTEDRRRYRGVRLPRNVKVWHRDRIEEAQKLLAATPGVTVLIHDQECAAELRRKRKRGLAIRPETRIVINERICEGCGDCGMKSNCLSVQPVDTEFGRKTRIHQSSCNSDDSCLKGDCPAFMVVTPGTHPSVTEQIPDLPLEDLQLPAEIRAGAATTAVRFMGIGGTGVVTVSQIVAVAGWLAGRYVRTLDHTGLAQKGGAVTSDIVLSSDPFDAPHSISSGQCDVFVALDLLAASTEANLATTSTEHTVAVISTTQTPTGSMVSDPTVAQPDNNRLLDEALARTSDKAGAAFDAAELSRSIFGSDQSANILMLGAAWQTGAINVPADAVEAAIRLNGTAVDRNIQAFRRGRQRIFDPVGLTRAVGGLGRNHELPPEDEECDSLDGLINRRIGELTLYQDRAYAQSYASVVTQVRQAETLLGTGHLLLTEAVARNLFKLMAYKDEYEVARLALDPATRRGIEQEFGANAVVRLQFHPPFLRALGMRRKIGLGPWVAPVLHLLRRGRVVRGKPWDLFGRTELRRTERRLVVDYRTAVAAALNQLTDDTQSALADLLGLPDMIRGYEEVKMRNVDAYEKTLRDAWESLRDDERRTPLHD